MKMIHFFNTRRFLAIIILMVPLSFVAGQSTNSIEGTWKNDKKGSIITVYEEGGLYYGEVIGSENEKEDQKIKSQDQRIIILRSFEHTEAQRYCCGTLFIPKKQKSIPASLELSSENSLQIHINMGAIKRTVEWTRVEELDQSPNVSKTK